jgi:hypothetical protein
VKRLVVVLLALFLASCTPDTTTTTTGLVDPSSPTSVSAPTDDPSSETTTTIEAQGASTTLVDADTTSTGDPATTTTSEPPPTTTPTGEGETLVVAAYEPVLGVPIGTDFDAATAELEEILGAPDNDTGWGVGCPLDGEEANERSLTWGSLRVDFFLTDTGRLSSWVYDATDGEHKPDGVLRLQLPGDVNLGDSMSAVAGDIGVDLVIEPTFDAAIVGEDGYFLWGFPAGGDAPLSLIGVPYVPVCE